MFSKLPLSKLKMGFDSQKIRILFFLFLPTLTMNPNYALAQSQVDLQVEGVIKPHCAFEQNQSASNQANTDMLFAINPEDPNWAGQSGKVALSLSCNAPFTLAARSSQGGLKNLASDTKNIGGNFSNEIAYQIALTMTTDDGAAPLLFSCHSSGMVKNDTNCGASSGTNVAIGSGAGVGDIAVTLSGSSGFPIRGRYQDTIVLALAFQ
jgi:hypothetical protein